MNFRDSTVIIESDEENDTELDKTKLEEEKKRLEENKKKIDEERRLEETKHKLDAKKAKLEAEKKVLENEKKLAREMKKIEELRLRLEEDRRNLETQKIAEEEKKKLEREKRKLEEEILDIERRKLEEERERFEEEKRRFEERLKGQRYSLSDDRLERNGYSSESLKGEAFESRNWNKVVSLFQVPGSGEYRIEIDPDSVPPQVENKIAQMMDEFSRLKVCSNYKTAANQIFQVDLLMRGKAEKAFDNLVQVIGSK